MPGKGDLILTGQLGDVMQESARAALSYARARTGDYGLGAGLFRQAQHPRPRPRRRHPEGWSLGGDHDGDRADLGPHRTSGAQGRRDDRGDHPARARCCPSAGLREKTVAAHRGGIKTFILPRRNAKDLAELPGVVRDGMELIQVDSLEQVLAAALLPKAQTGPVPVQVA